MGVFLRTSRTNMAEEGVVFVIGNPLLDISATVDASYLEKYNLKPADAILAGDEHLQIYPEMIENYKVEYSAGGAGQNTARSLTWMLATHNVATYVGCIGNDEYGRILEASAIADGVNVQYLKDAQTPTGTCACLIVNHDRSLVAYLGAANKYQKDHFHSEPIQQFVNQAKFVYAAGFFLTVSPDTLLELGKHASEQNKLFMFNLAAPFLIDFFTDPLQAVLPYTDIVIGNEHEGASIGKKLFGTEDLKEVATKIGQLEKINSKRERIVIITHGEKPVIVYKDGKVTEYETIPLEEKDIVDSNGAGDCFAGGFLASLIKGRDIEQCVKAGNYCASEILKTGGIVFNHGPSTFEL